MILFVVVATALVAANATVVIGGRLEWDHFHQMASACISHHFLMVAIPKWEYRFCGK